MSFLMINNGLGKTRAMKFFYRSMVLLFVLLLSSACAQILVNDNVDKSEAAKRYIEAALAHLEQGDIRKAFAHLQKSESLEKKSVELFNAYALLYRAEGDDRKEEIYYKRALRESKNDARTKNNYGIFLCFHDEPAKGLKLLDEATNDYQYSGRAEAFVNKGLCELNIGKKSDAETSFQQALRLNTSSSRPLLELTTLFLEKNDYRTANMYYQQYLSRVSQQSARTLWLGIRLAEQRNDRSTIASYALQLEKMFPKSKEYKEYLKLKK